MGEYLQILAFIVAGIIFLWLGYNIIFGKKSPFYPGGFSWKDWKKKGKETRDYSEPQVCPVCSMTLLAGEQLKTVAFPVVNDALYRMMHIKGCYSCLENGAQRKCPVCTKKLKLEDFLVARIFDRPNRKHHVHVLGCNYCKKVSAQQSQ